MRSSAPAQSHADVQEASSTATAARVKSPERSPDAAAGTAGKKRMKYLATSPDGRLAVRANGDVVQLESDRPAKQPAMLFNVLSLPVENKPRDAQTIDADYAHYNDFSLGIWDKREGVYGPAFAPDSHTLIFMTYAMGDSHAVYAVDLGTRRVRFVEAANSVMMISKCRDKTLLGKLIAWPRFSTYRGVRFIDQPVVMDLRGRALGMAGNYKRFLADRCGIGTPPEPVPEPVIPAYPPPDVSHTCGDETFKYTVIQFLDGTREAYFVGPHANTWAELLDNLREHCPEVLVAPKP